MSVPDGEQALLLVAVDDDRQRDQPLGRQRAGVPEGVEHEQDDEISAVVRAVEEMASDREAGEGDPFAQAAGEPPRSWRSAA